MTDTACSLKSGEEGVVCGCVCLKRLADMGCVPGQLVKMVCSGNPCILKVGCSFFGMGQAYQQYIQISCKSCKYSTESHE